MKTQIIKKGNHYTNWWQRRWGICPQNFVMNIKVDKSWWYPYKNPDSYDINKIVGSSFGDHRQNSLRLGWVPDFENEGVNKLYWYSTENGVDSKDNHYIGFVHTDEIIQLERDGNYFDLFFLDNYRGDNYFIDESFYYEGSSFTHPKKNGFSYWTNPYYGYPNKAPHDIKFESKILYYEIR